MNHIDYGSHFSIPSSQKNELNNIICSVMPLTNASPFLFNDYWFK